MRYLWPVSYTHLDVYKRQVHDGQGALRQAATEPKNPAGLPKQRCHPVYPAWRKDTLPRVRHSEDSDG